MVQYNSGTRYQKTNYTLRFDHMLGDGSRLLGNLNHELGNANEIWVSTTINCGGEGSAWRRLSDHVALVGWTHTF